MHTCRSRHDECLRSLPFSSLSFDKVLLWIRRARNEPVKSKGEVRTCLYRILTTPPIMVAVSIPFQEVVTPSYFEIEFFSFSSIMFNTSLNVFKSNNNVNLFTYMPTCISVSNRSELTHSPLWKTLPKLIL